MFSGGIEIERGMKWVKHVILIRIGLSNVF